MSMYITWIRHLNVKTTIILKYLEPNHYLAKKLRLDDKALQKLFVTMHVFTLSIEENLEPTLDWLQDRLELSDTALSKMIQLNPQILSYSIPDNLEPKLNWLQQRLEMSDTALSKLIQKWPAILCLSIPDNIEPKLNWIHQRLCLTDEELSKLIQKLPPLLGCNIDTNIEPTINFYIDAMGAESKAIAFVIRNPASLSRSLEKRLKPRLQEAQEAGMIINSKSLALLAMYTNNQWEKKMLKQMRKSS